MITYNKYGNVALPLNVEKSLEDLWSTIVHEIGELSVIEERAIMSDINLRITNNFCEHILIRQMSIRRDEKQQTQKALLKSPRSIA